MKKIISALALLAACHYASAQNEVAPPPQPQPVRDQKALTSVEVMPEFQGGQPALMKYLNNNILYPQAARELGVQGKVIVKFIVTKAGDITDVSLLRDIGSGCGAEAVRVITAMPKWIPGKQGGQPVDVYFTLPVTFRIEEPVPVVAPLSLDK